MRLNEYFDVNKTFLWCFLAEVLSFANRDYFFDSCFV